MAGMNTKWRTRTERMCVWRADEARGGPVERKVNVWRARALHFFKSNFLKFNKQNLSF